MLDQILVDTQNRDKEWCHKISLAKMGHSVSKKTRKKISQSNKRKWQDSEYRQMMSDKHKGKTISKEVRKKMSESRKKIVFDKKRKNQLDEARKKRKFDLDTRIKMSNSSKIKWQNKTYRKYTMKNNKGLFKKGDYIFYPRKTKDGPNNLEQIIIKIVPSCVEYTGSGDFWVKLFDRFKNPDFVVRPFSQTKKVIEVYGDYWHRNDSAQDIISLYKKRNISCLVLWEHEIKGNIKYTQKRINNFIKNKYA